MAFTEEMAEVFIRVFDDEEGQECIRGDFAELGAEEAARLFRQAERILGAYTAAAESISVPLYVALAEAGDRAREGRLVAERYARQGDSQAAAP